MARRFSRPADDQAGIRGEPQADDRGRRGTRTGHGLVGRDAARSVQRVADVLMRTLENGETAFAMDEVHTGARTPLISKTASDPTGSFAQFADDPEAAADQEGD